MFAYGTDLSKVTKSDALMPRPQYGTQPYATGTQQPQQTRNSQNNDQMYATGKWAYNQAPSPQPKAPDMSVYGRAQPVQPQSQGTPYGQQPSPFGQQYTPPSPPPFPANAGQQSNPFANMQPGVYDASGRFLGQDMSLINQRQTFGDALGQISQANDARVNMFGNLLGMNVGSGAIDQQAMMQQAQRMMDAGWTNPFNEIFARSNAIQRDAAGGNTVLPNMQDFPGQPQVMGFPTPGPQMTGGGGSWRGGGVDPRLAYSGWAQISRRGGPTPAVNPQRNAVQDLFARNNIQAPPGFLDQLIGLLGGNAPQPQLPPMSGLPPRPGPAPGRKRSWEELNGDFYDPDPGGPKGMVVEYWHNPQTGEEYSNTGTIPRPGTGWVRGKFPQPQLPAPGGAQRPIIHQHSPTDTLISASGPYRPAPQAPGTAQPGQTVRREEWAREGRPGYEADAPGFAVTGRSSIDGTEFGRADEAAAYDNWLRSQPGGGNPTSPRRREIPLSPPQRGIREGQEQAARETAAMHNKRLEVEAEIQRRSSWAGPRGVNASDLAREGLLAGTGMSVADVENILTRMRQSGAEGQSYRRQQDERSKVRSLGLQELPTQQQALLMGRIATGERGLERALRETGWKGPLTMNFRKLERAFPSRTWDR